MPNLESLKNIINLQITTVISVVVFVVLALNNLVNTNILATQGAIVSEMELKTISLEKQNHDLTVQIAELSRLSDLENQAESLGFYRTQEIVIAPNTSAFALK